MASDRHSAQRATFPAGLLAIVVGVAVVTAVAWAAVGAELALPVLVLGILAFGAAIVYRTVGTSSDAATANRDTVPRLNAEDERPLGDTPQAHDEISPHDLPADHPGRHVAEEMAGGPDGTTSGMAEGGAAGEGGRERDPEDRREPTEEAERGSRATEP